MTSLDFNQVKKLPGWLGRTDFELLRGTLKAQDGLGVSGSIVEIGVHHGKSFIPLAVFGKTSRLYAIDIFGDQHLNVDQSGNGNLEAFQRNLRTFGIAPARLEIDRRLSTAVRPDDVIEKVGPPRLFHIDGGHHLDAISSDLSLACNVLRDAGVIVVDDVFRPEWPEVSAGVFQSQALRDNDFVIFAIGFNKTFLCRRQFRAQYQEALSVNPVLAKLLHKTYDSPNDRYHVYQRYPLPEWHLKSLLSYIVELKFSNFYLKYKKGK